LGTMRVENPLPPFQLYRNNTFPVRAIVITVSPY
jgi:hypothetical protein